MQASRQRSRRARTDARAPDFIGIGAQRTGTSWIYACLYEHPEICMPRKEINFFSRERNWDRGFSWYERVFAECPPGAIAGEFSTSYLTDPTSPARIRRRYPGVRLIVSLRHPVDRAYSNYLNDIVAGTVPAAMGFREALRSHPEYLESGRYARYLKNYLDLFPRERLLVSIFDDARRDPRTTIESTYRFLGVDPAFRPSMLTRPVGIGRVPRFQRLERWLIDGATAMRRRRPLRAAWWTAKRLGIGDRLRALNTDRTGAAEGMAPEVRQTLIRELEPEATTLDGLLNTALPGWRR